jgi:hypothetical protein
MYILSLAEASALSQSKENSPGGALQLWLFSVAAVSAAALLRCFTPQCTM